ncbi:MAG: TolC family protein, partial [Gammaproteobacteria bacterium]|nr:TolC family protein [Gammaproteobacteria bacterium]
MRALAALVPLLVVLPVAAQTAEQVRPLRAILDDYVQEALASNLALRSQQFDVERQLALLAEARSRFLPQLDFEARYARADGGREIELPIGDVINPAYQTLNELLLASGQPTRFDNIPDPSFQLLREREQDTRLRLRQPVYAPAIPAAFRAQRATLDSAQYARQALARRLERDVTVGYLDWLRARSSVEIVESSLALLQENLRVNDSLYANGRVTRDQVLRARAELLEVQQQRREIGNLAARNRQLLNFLMNRELDAPLEMASPGSRDPAHAVNEAAEAALLHDDIDMRSGALSHRPELREVEALERAADFRVDQQRGARQPLVSIGV